MRKVLMLAYFFPPAGGGGVQRTTKFVKYLPEYGWQPVVLTVNEQIHTLRDSSLKEDLPADLIVKATSAWQLPTCLPWRVRRFISRWLLIVDEQMGWYRPAVLTGEKMIRELQPEVLYTTSAPYSSHLVGRTLKRKFNLPWLADFRDPWVGNFTVQPPTPIHAAILRSLESSVVHLADRIVVVSEPMRQAMLTRYPDLPETNFITITNGFDPQDLTNAQVPGAINDRFVITYSGTFYGSQRTPDAFLQGVKQAIADGLVSEERVEIRFVGNTGAILKEAVKKYTLGHVVNLYGYVSHRASIQHLLAANLLLLVIGTGPGSEAVMTGKIFEYLATGRPILGLAPAGAARQLIQEAHAGICVDPQDIGAIAAALGQAYRNWQNGQRLVHPDPSILERYDRRNLTGRLAGLFNELLQPS